jgi:uncharacterized protein YjbI with pentapeptide repeats
VAGGGAEPSGPDLSADAQRAFWAAALRPLAQGQWTRPLVVAVALLERNWHTMKFSDQRMDGCEFKNCSLANAVFDDVNLSGAKLTNVNLSDLIIENANIKGLKIFGYDVESWIREQLRKDGCHLD